MATSASFPALLLVATLILVLSLAPTSEAKIVGNRTECPTNNKCGVYLNRQTNKLLVCRQCGSEPKKAALRTSCNWYTGNCVNSTNGEGSLCTQKVKCGRQFLCQTVRYGTKDYRRCCYAVCPPGLCGHKGLFYTNTCGYTYRCPETC